MDMEKKAEDTKRKVSGNAIVNGIIWQQLLLYFFPLLFGTFFQQLYNTVDAVIVGRFVSKQALAAVGGSSATIVNLYVGFFIGVASGATVIIARSLSQRRRVLRSSAVLRSAVSVFVSTPRPRKSRTRRCVKWLVFV